MNNLSPIRRMLLRSGILNKIMLTISRMFTSGSPPLSIVTASIAVALLAIVPLFYILLRALQAPPEIWARLLQNRIPELLVNTLGLGLTVTAVTIIISVLLAYLTVRTDLPGRKIIHWLLVIPLAIPGYIGAFAYITFFGYNGTAEVLLAKIPGLSSLTLFLPSIYSFGGVVLVLSLFTFPYVYLLVAPALRSGGRDLEEAAISCGLNRCQVFFKITLPLLRPAMAAGGLLVFLYVLSDFGTVAMLRFPTFTNVIYLQLIGRYDRSAAAVLSLLLMIIALSVIYLEWHYRKNARYYQGRGNSPGPIPVPLGRWRYPSLFLIINVIILSVIAPLSLLSFWSITGIAGGSVTADFLYFARNSLLTAGVAASLSIVMALPLVYYAVRYNNLLGKTLVSMVYAGYALPGVILALGVIFIVSSKLPFLYGSVILLVLAYIIKFITQSIQAEEAALAQVNPHLEEAARLSGCSAWSAFIKVVLPLIRPGLISGWILVFISSIKELPATLLLRPAGFDTLSVRIWIEASEGYFDRGAPAALLLVIISILPIKFLLDRYQCKGGIGNGAD